MAIILVIWKPSDRETLSKNSPFIIQISEGVCHNIEELSIFDLQKKSQLCFRASLLSLCVTIA